MLVDDEVVLRRIFEVAPTLIATHCESSPRIRNNLQKAQNLYGANIPAAMHPIIRNAAVCYDSSSLAVSLARETGARLHILHLTTAQEMELFAPGPLDNKHITAEACAHHLLFDESDYVALGMRLKTNPAVKSRADREALHLALAEGRIDVLATDHAPHLPAEKDQPYIQAAAGMPLVEYALPAYLELVADGVLTYAQVATKAAGAVADIFSIRERGYIREGYYADLVLVEKTPAGTPARKAVLSKCGWTPFADYRFRHSVHSTYVNGHLVWNEEEIQERVRGMALEFDR
jgi:dihydroorotase